jgi:hypothetical protein
MVEAFFHLFYSIASPCLLSRLTIQVRTTETKIVEEEAGKREKSNSSLTKASVISQHSE